MSLSPPHSRIVTPTTSCPSSSSSAAATDESTPPLIASSTFTSTLPATLTASTRRSVATASTIDVDGAVDVGVGGRAPERQPQRAPRPRSVDTHRGEHVRRLHRAAGARRRGRLAQTSASSSRNSSASLSTPVEAHVGRAGDLAVAGHGLDDAVDRAARPSTRRSRRPREPRVLAVALGVGRGQRLGHGDDAGDVVRAAAALALLAAAERAAARARRRRGRQHADALRPAELVGAERQQVDERRDRAQVEPARGLHGVGVEQRRRRPLARRAAATAARSVTVPTSLLTAITLTRARRRVRARRRARRGRRGRRASTPTTRPPRCSTGWSTAWCSAAGHTARAAVRSAPRMAGLSASVPPPVNTTSPGGTPSAVGDHVAGLVDRPAGLAGEAVRAGRVGEALGEERQHRLDRLGAHRRRRRVVEVGRATARPQATERTPDRVRPVHAWSDRRCEGYGPALVRRRLRRRLRRLVPRAVRRRRRPSPRCSSSPGAARCSSSASAPAGWRCRSPRPGLDAASRWRDRRQRRRCSTRLARREPGAELVDDASSATWSTTSPTGRSTLGVRRLQHVVQPGRPRRPGGCFAAVADRSRRAARSWSRRSCPTIRRARLRRRRCGR